MTIRCKAGVKSADSDPSSSPSSEEEVEAEAKASVGSSRVKVTAPLKVYHLNRVPEVDLEGTLKDYVAVWKGKRISANLEFFKEVEGRGLVKFVSHLKEDEFEFEFLDDDGTTIKAISFSLLKRCMYTSSHHIHNSAVHLVAL
ncbi:unnamed protein product [Brassica rapa]|uniref:Ferredoxin thioredoxin reductase alpha chain domain-containing protein n=3 Tax=Brassica TaxID=3705 RepID=A0A3P5YJH0_BRACM|nr:unnamed protein product [Brassica napus]CAG7871944.1 unnamed protein product [Brassica rapa]VDC67832.1 unnamed protein product [Brassica rapa]